MELAREGRAGKRLGELSGMANAAAIIGSFIVFIGFRYLHFNFTVTFIIAAVGYMAASSLMFLMKKDEAVSLKEKIRFRKKYGLFYWLNILYGTRKQLFLTFAPWVLVQVFSKRIEYVAMIFTIGGIVGILFKPLLGRAIDKFGERTILMAEAAVLIFVCVGYGFSRNIFPENIALFIASVCYIIDQLLMAVGMARATYLKKIAVKAEEIAPTLSIGVSIDHVFSISIALLGGLVWKYFGYQYVFLMGGIIAVVNLFSASRIRIKSPVPDSLISGTS
jgi:predicted MFS family arabinose efflux permease